MIITSFNSLDELDIAEEKKKKEREKETRREPQLLVSTSEISAPIDIP
jgi:hypothetical protein